MQGPRHRFSEHFEITVGPRDDWFDPLLPADTKLFVDPFRIYAEGAGQWSGAHDHLIEFFNLVMQLLARSGLKSSSAHWHAAERLLLFPEPAEFCLGYGETPLGMGAGSRLRRAMVKGAATSIVEGVKSVRHFEEMVLFQAQIGPDRVSDVVCNVLKSRFVAYTNRICRRHDLPTETIEVPHSSWSRRHRRWEHAVHDLPRNPYTGRAVLLTPKGWRRRALVEIKLANNTSGWHGLETQTPTYMKAEGIRCGYFVTIQYRDDDLKQDRIKRVKERATEIGTERGYTIKPIFVDARPKPSASKA